MWSEIFLTGSVFYFGVVLTGVRCVSGERARYVSWRRVAKDEEGTHWKMEGCTAKIQR